MIIYRSPNNNFICFEFPAVPEKEWQEFFLIENKAEVIYNDYLVTYKLPINDYVLEIVMFLEQEYQAIVKESVKSVIRANKDMERARQIVEGYKPIYPLKDHQKEALIKILTYPVHALFHDPGLGKTKTILDMFTLRRQENPKLKLIIICPNFLVLNWKLEANKHTPQFNVVPLHKGTKNKIENLSLQGDIYVTNVESIAPRSFSKEYESKGQVKVKKVKQQAFQEVFLDFLTKNECIGVIDESTSIKSPSASTTKFCLKIKNFLKYRYILTGTPIPNTLLDIWSQLTFLDDFATGFDRFNNFKSYHFEFTGDYNNILVRVRFEQVLYDNIRRFADIKKKAECYDLPEKIYKVTYIEMPKELKTAYKDLVKKCVAEFKTLQNQGVRIEKTHILSKAQTLMQVCKGFLFTQELSGDIDDPKIYKKALMLPCNKYQTVYDLLSTEYYSSNCIIWTTHVPERELLVHFLKSKKHPHECLFPGMKAEDIADRIERFQKGEIRTLVCSLQSFNKGITLTNADVEIFCSNSYNWEMRAQAEDRTHRIGTVRSPVYHDIITEDSIEELIYRNLQKKGDFAEEFIKELIKR